ncbi:MAG: hypothetical protein IKN26_07430 [Eubacterium sp.]|nr:hypothetical protein [Eubacterium sp.]
MQSIDMEYFNEYKSVEKICNEMYGENGVSAYINVMQHCTSREKSFIVNWDKKLKDLKHLRWLRNQIAHPNDSYEVTPQDLTDIKAFYDELMTQQDPLALLYKEIESTKKKQQEYKLQQRALQKTIHQMQPQSQSPEPSSDISLPMVLAFAAMLIAVASIIIFILFK